MNAFRLVFLASVLGASVLFAFARLTPDVWEDQLVRTLEQRAESEVRSALAVERHAMAEREAVATHIAADRNLAAALDPSATNAPAVAPTFARVRDAHLRDDSSWAVVFDARGEPLAPAAFRGVVTPRDFGDIADVARALESGEVQTRYAMVTGRLFAAVAVPVHSSGSRPIGAVVVAHEFSGQTAAERRAAGALDLAFFANREVVASTTAQSNVSEELASLVRRTDENSVGTRHGIRGRSLLRYTATFESLDDTADLEAQERIAMLVPVRFDGATDELVGAVVIVDAPSPPRTLAGILIEGRAFDDGTIIIWVFVMGGLLIFFVGLLVHDFAQGRAIRHLADRIADRITMNEPTSVKEDTTARYLRPIADAFNRFLDAYRQTAHLARNAQAEASVASHEVGELQHKLQELQEGSGEIRIPMAVRRITRPPAPPVDDDEDLDLLDPDAFADEPSAVGHDMVEPAQAPATSEARPTRRTAAVTGADRVVPPAASPATASRHQPTPPPVPAATHPTPAATAADARLTVDTGDVPTFEAADDTPTFEAVGDAPAFELADDPPAPAPTPASDDAPADPFDALDALAGGPPPQSPPPAPGLEPASAGEVADDTHDALFASDGAALATSGDAETEAPAGGTDYDNSAAFDEVMPDLGQSAEDDAPPEDRPEADTVIPGANAPAGPPSWEQEAGQQLASMLDDDTEATATDAQTASAAPPAAPEPTAPPVSAATDEPAASPVSAATDEPASEPTPEPASPSGAPAEPDTTETSSEDLLAAAEERLKRIRASRSSAPFVTETEDPRPDDEDPEMRALFDEFVAARRSVGDDVSRFAYDGFATRIQKNRAKLIKQYECRDVKFRVEVGNGKATLKATPIR